jgi:glucokinase
MRDNRENLSQTVLGIDLGGTRIKVGMFRFRQPGAETDSLSRYERLSRVQAQTTRHLGERAVFEEIARATQELLDLSSEKPEGIGFCCPGIVDPCAKTLVRAPLFASWKDVPLGKMIEDRFELPVCMDNDANVAALAEASWGAAARTSTSAYITVSTGLGIGLILDKRIWRGTHGISGELCHIAFSGRSESCESGHAGCAEAFCTGVAISNRASQLLGRPLTAPQVFSLADEGDSAAKDVIKDAVRTLAVVVAFIQNTIDPQVVVLGEGVINSHPGLVSAIASVYPEIVDYPRLQPNLKLACLADDASLLGSATLCWQEMYGSLG